ncbi:hypothetical protein BD408DRAFT_421951 [Parasitella parasitica]|nr:hypothetical protein BD408DRAFT_421951 [Parasitella parasitica]
MARECPLAISSVQPSAAAHSDRPVKACYNCGKPGHIARKCFTAKRERDEDTDGTGNESDDDGGEEDITDSELSATESESDQDRTA